MVVFGGAVVVVVGGGDVVVVVLDRRVGWGVGIVSAVVVGCAVVVTLAVVAVRPVVDVDVTDVDVVADGSTTMPAGGLIKNGPRTSVLVHSPSGPRVRSENHHEPGSRRGLMADRARPSTSTVVSGSTARLRVQVTE